MQTLTTPSEYVGALIEDEQRLVLVSVDPDDPWDAFRALRRTMRRVRKPAAIGWYETDAPIQLPADVISLASRRRAG